MVVFSGQRRGGKADQLKWRPGDPSDRGEWGRKLGGGEANGDGEVGGVEGVKREGR